MNKDKILELADFIDKLEHVPWIADNGFNMGGYCHPCGTPSCIAGWASYIFTGKASLGNSNRVASEILDLPYEKAVDLFLPEEEVLGDGGYKTLEIIDPTPQQAATVLRHLVKTGKVDWLIVGFNVVPYEDD